MLKAIIIDDEADARYLLRKMLIKHFNEEIEVIGEAESCASGIGVLKNLHPDIVFLDVQLGDGTGFELLSNFESLPFHVVFVTAYDRFAIKAFEFSAIGYLVKPINLTELQKVIERIISQKVQLKRNQSGIKVLIENYKAEQVRKIVIPHSDGFSVVLLDDIVFVNSIRNYSEFNFSDKTKLITSKTLIIYEKLLIDHGFFRIHQTYLVNLSHVTSFVRSEGGVLKMSTGELLPVARQKKADLMNRFL